MYSNSCSEEITMKSNLISGILCFLSVSCVNVRTPYDNVTRAGEEKISVVSLTFDTLRLDARFSSLEGRWYMGDSAIYFVDKYVVGVSEYDTCGNFVRSHIRQGRGPNEMTASAYSSAFDTETGDCIIQDSNCSLYRFNSSFEKVSATEAPWFMSLDSAFTERDWKALYNNPDPESPEMYEYNYVCRRMCAYDGTVVIPVTTEHIRYNGFDGNRAYWRDSYIFISLTPEAIPGTRRLFGHYPPVYQKRPIPVFADYDFFLSDSTLTVSFAADPAVYVMDYSGNVLCSFGAPEKGISMHYPSTRSFEEYERIYEESREEYGYYARLSSFGGYIFRSCKLDGTDGGWVLQIYDGKTYDLIGRVPVNAGFEVIGEYAGKFYAFQSVDADAEEFILLKFEI